MKVVASEENTGIAGAFNRALDAHTGEYIAWLGGDDVMLPGKLSRQVAALQARPDAIGCCHDADVFDSDSGRSYGRFTEVYNGRRGVRDGGVELLLDPGLHDAAVDDDGALVRGGRPALRPAHPRLERLALRHRAVPARPDRRASTTCSRATAGTSAT